MSESPDRSSAEPDSQFDVRLYIYDLSKGFARAFSAMILGKELPGIWHTGVVVHGREYFFSQQGISSCQPGGTVLGEPDQILNLGKTEIPYSLFLEFIFSLGESSFAPGVYDLFEHNCNSFSNEVTLFLVGKGIPREIIDLPQEVLSTPLGQTLKTYLKSFDVRPQGNGVNLAGAVTERSRKKSNARASPVKTENSMAEKGDNSDGALNDGPKAEARAQADDQPGEETGQEEKKTPTRKTYKYDDPPLVYREVDGAAALKKLSDLVAGGISEEQTRQLKDWQEYLTTNNGAWALDTQHMELIAHFLSGGEGKFAPNVPLLTLQALQAAALKDDFVLVLHQDRKDHRLMSYINRVENLTLAEQEEIIKLLCNLCSQPSSFDWLMYISEWCESDGFASSNSKTTTRAAVHTLLNDKLTTLQKTGVNLIFNLALKELFEDIATELATAVLQFVHGDLDEEQAFFCLTALLRFMIISYNEVPALTKMLGPDLSKFKGKSQRIDDVLVQIEQKLKASLPASAV